MDQGPFAGSRCTPAQNVGRDADVTEIKATLADFDDTELAGLIAVASSLPSPRPHRDYWHGLTACSPGRLGEPALFFFLAVKATSSLNAIRLDGQQLEFDPEQPLDLPHSSDDRRAIFGQRLR